VATGYEGTVSANDVFCSGNWVVDDAARDAQTLKTELRPRSATHLAALAVLFATSSITSSVDPWREAQRGRAQMTMSAVFEPCFRRRITGTDARRLALDILRRAEKARAAFARAEAKGGVDWEGNS
jgi:hypothetical protein